MKFPEKIYVQICNENEEEEYIDAGREPVDLDNDGILGVYELKETMNRRTETIMETTFAEPEESTPDEPIEEKEEVEEEE